MNDNKRPLIKIEYENSIPAKDLANYFIGLNNEFKTFIKENKYEGLIIDELKIQEIKQGSIEIYPFIEYATSTLPILDQVSIFIDFFNSVISFLKMLKKDDPSLNCSQKKLANYNGINGVNVSGDHNEINYMVINVENPSDIQKIDTITNADSKLIDQNIKRRLNASKTLEEISKKATVFYCF